MTLSEAIRHTQGRNVGMVSRLSVRYAQTLLCPAEQISAALMANIVTRRERFPGVVILTESRVLAVCGLPGIKRAIICDLDELEKWEESPAALHYKVTFFAGERTFSMTIDPDVGEKFSRCLAVLNGTETEFDAAGDGAEGRLLNPTLVRNMRRAKQEKSKTRARRAQAFAQSRADAANATIPDAEEESVQETAQRLAHQVDAARAAGQLDDTDPQVIAARLAAELAAEEAQHRN